VANVPGGIGSQNVNQPTPVQPAVLASNPSAPLQTAVSEAINPSIPKQESGSPWDDDLDVTATPEKNNPTIVGSLDPKAAPLGEKASPLKIPENVEETVGKKIPAISFVGTAQNKAMPIVSDTPENPSQLPPQPIEQSELKASSGFLGGLFKKKKEQEKIAAKTLSIAKATGDTPNRAEVPPSLEPRIKEKVEKENNKSIFKRVLILIPGLVLVFALATFLTEEGLLSIGMENVYGALKIEQLWGGLSSKTETALGRSAITMQNHPDFKAGGTISVTIDKAIKSDMVTPLLGLSTGQGLVARDTNINPSIKAIQTASDDYYFTTNSNSNANSNLNLNSNSATPPTNSNLNSNSNENINSNSDIGTNSTSESSSSGTRVVEGVFSLKTSGSSNEANITLNDATSSKISLVNNNNLLFVKTSGAVNYGSTDINKWLTYNIDKLKDKSVTKSIFNLNVNSGFSVTGARVGNEKIDNIRCYKYRIDSLEIGSSLSDIGITSDMVPSLSGDVWIGIKDKLIHKMSIKITTPVSSAVRMVNLDMSFSEFDVKNSITTVSNSDSAQTSDSTETNLTGDDKRKADATSLIEALTRYKADNKSYPVSASFMKLNSSNNTIAKALIPRYLTVLPEDPKASAGWYYAYKSLDGTKCTISVRLENQSDKTGSLVNNVLLYFKDSGD